MTFDDSTNPHDDFAARDTERNGPPAFGVSNPPANNLPEVADSTTWANPQPQEPNPVPPAAPMPPYGQQQYGQQQLGPYGAPGYPVAGQAHPPQAYGYPQPQYPVAGYPPQQYQTAPKNPGLAALLSFFWPGLGHIYNGNLGLGIILVIVNVVNFFLLFVIIGFLTGFVTWIFAIVHSYQEAQAYNRQLGFVS